MDYTHAKYEELCKALVDSDCMPVSVCTYLDLEAQPQPNRCIIIRHDIDRKPERALKMAKIENRLGIASTYYFRKKEDVFKPEIIGGIANMGHEIGIFG